MHYHKTKKDNIFCHSLKLGQIFLHWHTEGYTPNFRIRMATIFGINIPFIKKYVV